MMNSLYKLALDFSKELNYTKAIMARQGDKGIIVSVKPFLNGLQMDTSGATFTLKGTTPSNRYVDSVAISVTDEEVIFSLDGTFMSEEGYYKHCYVEYRKDDQVLTTQDIIFFSLGVSDISQGQAGEYISQLERLIQEYNETFDTFINQIEVRAEGLETQLTNLKTDSTLLQEKLDDLKEAIKKLSNLSVMYSNSIDFGDYDYSGNPNLFRNIDSNNWIVGTGVTKGSEENATTFTLSDSTTNPNAYVQTEVPILSPNKKYTMSTKVFLDNPASSNNYLLYRLNKQSGSLSYLHIKLSDLPLNEWIEVETMANQHEVSFDPSEITSAWLQLLLNGFTGTIKIKNELKIEEGESATPYQPNLLVAPFYLSKQVTGERMFKYFGTGIKDSDNPNDFVWDLTPEYIEANFAKGTDVKTNTNNIKTLIEDLRVVTANVAWMKNNTYVLGKWQNLPLAGGYQGGDGTIPKYRIDTIDGYKKLSFSGAVTTTNNTLPSQSQQHAISTLPKALIPSVTKMGIGPTSSLSTSCRIAVTSSGNLYVGNDSGKDVKYCYLDTFSYWLD